MLFTIRPRALRAAVLAATAAGCRTTAPPPPAAPAQGATVAALYDPARDGGVAAHRPRGLELRVDERAQREPGR